MTTCTVLKLTCLRTPTNIVSQNSYTLQTILPTLLDRYNDDNIPYQSEEKYKLLLFNPNTPTHSGWYTFRVYEKTVINIEQLQSIIKKEKINLINKFVLILDNNNKNKYIYIYHKGKIKFIYKGSFNI